MNRAAIKEFLDTWDKAIFMALAGLVMFGMYLQVRSIGAAKQRIATERESIAETREKVRAIEHRLLTNDVPDRLGRIEESIGSAVVETRQLSVENRKAIQHLDERQQKLAAVVVDVLGVPEEAIADPPRDTTEPRQP